MREAAFLAIGLGGLAASAQAAVVTNTMVFSGVYNPATGALISNTPAGIAAELYSGQPRTYRVSVFTQWDGMSSDESFGNMSVDITLSFGLSRVPVNLGAIRANWQPNNPSLGAWDADANSLGNMFLKNGDAGLSTTDWLGIVVSVDNANIGETYDSGGLPITDPRLALARGKQFRIGAFDMTWDGHTTTTLTLTNQQWAVLNDTTKQFGPTVKPTDVPSLYFPLSPIPTPPEPASLGLIGLAWLTVARRRVRAREKLRRSSMRRAALFAAAALAGVSAQASVVVTNFMTIAGVYDPTTGVIISNTPAGIAAEMNSGQPRTYRIDVFTQWDGLAADESFGNVAIDVLLSTGLSRVPANNNAIRANWQANSPLMGAFDADGNSLGTMYLFNGDRGTDTTDLRGIAASVDNANIGLTYDSTGAPITDPRLALARGTPLRIGAFDVTWNGHTTNSIQLTNQQYAVLNDTSKQFGATVKPTSVPTIMLVPLIPEPASLGLIGLATAIGPLRRRRSAAPVMPSGLPIK